MRNFPPTLPHIFTLLVPPLIQQNGKENVTWCRVGLFYRRALKSLLCYRNSFTWVPYRNARCASIWAFSSFFFIFRWVGFILKEALKIDVWMFFLWLEELLCRGTLYSGVFFKDHGYGQVSTSLCNSSPAGGCLLLCHMLCSVNICIKYVLFTESCDTL